MPDPIYNALYIVHKPFACLIAVIDLAQYRPERKRVSMQELVPSLQIKTISGDN
jgi:hypothetical protein